MDKATLQELCNQGLFAWKSGDILTAFLALNEAAEKGHAKSQIAIAIMYRDGWVVNRDSKAKALEWFHKAAEQGDKDAQFNLGLMYYEGSDAPQDDVQAAKWFLKVAEQGHVEAQYNLGMMYEHGLGVPQDDAKAAEWYRKAAEQGDKEAKRALRHMRSKDKDKTRSKGS